MYKLQAEVAMALQVVDWSLRSAFTLEVFTRICVLRRKCFQTNQIAQAARSSTALYAGHFFCVCGAHGRHLAQHAYLAKQASLSGEPWADKFMSILGDHRMRVTRDYQVPLPATCMDGAVAKLAEYVAGSSMTRALYEMLVGPVTVKSGKDQSLRWVPGKRRLSSGRG